MLDRPAPRKGAEPDHGREDSHHDQRQRQAQSEGVTLQHHPRKRPRASRPLAWVDESGREPADQGGDDGNRRDHAQTDPALVEPRGDGDEGDKERCYRRFEDAGYGHDPRQGAERDDGEVDLTFLGDLAEEHDGRPAEGGVEDLARRPREEGQERLDDGHSSPNVLRSNSRASDSRPIGRHQDLEAFGAYSGTYKATVRSLTAPLAHLWTVRGGKIPVSSKCSRRCTPEAALRSAQLGHHS